MESIDYFKLFKATLQNAQTRDGYDKAFVKARINLQWSQDDNKYLAHMLHKMIFNFCEDIIMPNLDEPMFIHGAKFEGRMSDYDTDEILFTANVVSPVEQRPVVYKFIANPVEIPNDVHYCDFCSGHTKNDRRGHCCACGGPRLGKGGLLWR